MPWQVLGKAEDRLYAAVNKLPMILFALDEGGIITLSEGRGLKVLGYKPKELVGHSVYKLYKDRPDILTNIKRALAGESFTATSDLNGVLLETQFTPLHDVTGKFMGTISVSIDITERKRAEEALNQQKQEQQIILDSAPALIWYKDKQNKILRCNRAAAESIGLTRDQVEGRSTYKLYPEHAAKYHKDDLEVIKSGKPKIGIIEEYVGASGEKRWVRTDKVPYQDEHGNIIGVIVFAIDITDRKRVEEELRQTTSELQGIFQALPDLYFRLAADGTILDYKTEDIADLYLRPEEFMGRRMQDVLPSEVGLQFKKGIEKVLKMRSMISFEYSLPLQGPPQLFEARCSPLSDKQIVVIIRKITERKQAEALLAGQKQLLEEIAKGAPLHDVLGMLCEFIEMQSHSDVLCSILLLDQATKTLRHGAAPSLPKSYNEAIHGMSIGPKAGSCGTAAYFGKPVTVTDIAKDPLWKDFRDLASEHGLSACWSTPIVSSDGKVLGTCAMYFRQSRGPTPHEVQLTDISTQLARIAIEKQLSQEQLRQSENRFRDIIEHSKELFYTHTPDHVLTYVSPQARFFLGCDPKEAMVRWTEFVTDHPVNKEAMEHTERAIQTGKPQPIYPIELITRDGRKIWVEVDEAPIVQDGKTVAIVGALRDITERKRSEEALRESEERHRLMFEDNPMPMWVFDGETLQFLSVNDASIKHYGYTRQEFLSMTIKEIRPPEDIPLLMRILAEHPEESRIYGPIHHKKKDGTVIEVEISSHRINFAGRKARVVMVNDVTERKKAEQALLHSQKLESLGILAGGIAHDFNNLLMGVLGNSDLALQKLDPGSRIEIHLRQIKKASMRAAELCRQLLAYSGKGRLDVSFLDLNGMIKELTTLLELSIHKGVALNLCLENNLPHLLGDKVQIQQVIMNLVINSSEAIGDKEGSIIITTKKLHADRSYLSFSRFTPELSEGDYILFEVKDNGCGMDSGTLPQIFDPFFTTKFTGRGLGLAAVLGIVKGHGGALKVDSAKGEGTTFKILFPSHGNERAAPVRSGDPLKSGNEEWLGRGTILVVDDEEAVRAVSELILPTIGFLALVAPDGFRACELLHAHRDNVVAVMLDLTMPKMDGVRTVQELRKIKPGIKVLLMSGYDEEEAIDRFTNEGFDCFLQKPFVRSQLRDKLRSVLGGE